MRQDDNPKGGMKLGYLGLGKMGKNMVLHLLEQGHEIVAWNRSAEPRLEVAAAGAHSVERIEEVVAELVAPRVIWLMLPAGEVTDEYLLQVSELLSPGDLVIDGGNSFYKDTVRRAKMMASKQLKFMDVGTSGGPGGARRGACLMIGGDQADFERLKPLFKDIAAQDAYQFFPGNGAGHFVKMVHNGIEYGMMQAIAEGFAIMKAAPFKLDLENVANIYQHQSVIESRLVGWAKSGYEEHGQDLREITSTIAHTGEGEWTVNAGKEYGVETPIIGGSYQFRVDSAKRPSYTGKVVSMLRGQFGGHAIK